MSTTITAVKQHTVALNLPKSTPKLMTLTKSIVASMTNNTFFPSPDPTLASINTALGALDTAETAVKARTHGAVADRNTKRKAVGTLLAELKAYVQKVANGNPETAQAVIESAGLAVRKPVLRQKQAFGVKDGAVAGTVVLTAAATARRASYEWQYSPDGKTWTTMPVTLQARTSITGLVSGTTVLFRSRAVTKDGEGDWTQPSSVVVR